MAVKVVETAKSGLMSLIQVVLLFSLLVATIAWAKASPDTFQTVVNQIGDTLAALVIWVCGLIQDALPAPTT